MKRKLLFFITLSIVMFSDLYGQATTDFVTIWQTDNPGTSADSQISIPTVSGETYDYTVDWGDGQSESFTTDVSPIHDYGTPGTYEVRISGSFPRIFFDGGGDRQKLITISQWGNLQWTSMTRAFQGCTNLTITANDAPDLSGLTSLSAMFESCTSLTGAATDFNLWDTSQVTDMSATFRGATSFNGNIGSWNTTNVEFMGTMFDNAEVFNQDLAWNTANVTDMTAMFAEAINFNGNISTWNTVGVRSMSNMFRDATAFNRDLNAWNTINVSAMNNMFLNATSFNGNIGNWNTANVINMSRMFSGATNFNQDIGGWNTSRVNQMDFMFQNAINFNRDLGDWDISELGNNGRRISAGGMFDGATLSQPNYATLLLGWSTLDAGEAQIPTNVSFSGGNSQFCLGEDARQNLIDNFSWNIMDGGRGCPAETTITLQGGTLTITDTEGGTSDDTITLSSDGTTLTISGLTSDISVTGGPVATDDTTVTVALADITSRFIIQLEGGTDSITLATALDLGTATFEAEGLEAFTQNGALSASVIIIRAPGSLNIGNVTASDRILLQTTNGDITQQNGTALNAIDGIFLAGTDNVTLTNANNNLTQLEAIANILSFDDTNALNLSDITVNQLILDTGNDITLVSGSTLAINGNGNSTIGTSANNITGGGTINQNAGNLTITSGQRVDLTNIIYKGVSGTTLNTSLTNVTVSDGDTFGTLQVFNAIDILDNASITVMEELFLSEGTNISFLTGNNVTVLGTVRSEVGSIEPGPATGGVGTFTVGNIIIGGFSDYIADVGGAIAGTQHDQLIVNGTVTIGENATLLLQGGFDNSNGANDVIILSNDGIDPIVGTFNGLPQGTPVTIGSGLDEFNGFITYTGGDGNDISLVGDNRISIPNVVGLARADAEASIVTAGLSVGTITEENSDTVAAGSVISQDPAGNTLAVLGDTVNLVVSLGPVQPALIITGIMDSNISGSFLSALELYAVEDIPDLSIYAIGVAEEGRGSDGPEFTLSGSANAGEFIYIGRDAEEFGNFFGFAPDFSIGLAFELAFDGDDAVELYKLRDTGAELIDSYGEPDVNGEGQPWQYQNSWAYRINDTGPDGNFVIGNWRIPGVNVLSFVTTNATAEVPFPIGTFGQPGDTTPPSAVCQNVTVTLQDGGGGITLTADMVNNGSSDDTGIALLFLSDGRVVGPELNFNCREVGQNSIDLIAIDAAGNTGRCTANVRVLQGALTEVVCQDITVQLGLDGMVSVALDEVATLNTGNCFGEASQFFFQRGGEGETTISGETTSSSPTDTFSDDTVFFEQFELTVPETGEFTPNFSYTASDPDDAFFVFIYDEAFIPNSGEGPGRPGFVDAFVFIDGGTLDGSFGGENFVELEEGVPYFIQVFSLGSDNSTASFNGSFGGAGGGNTAGNFQPIVFTADDLGANAVTVMAIDDFGNRTTCQATITVEAGAAPFVTTWQTDNPGSSDDNTITIPTTGGGYNYTVDWGDGTIETGFTGGASHTYDNPGTFTVQITGDFPRIFFNNEGDRRKILTVEQWGAISWSSMERAFAGCANLDVPAEDVPDLSNVQNVRIMFDRCSSLVGTPTFNDWDLSTVTNTSFMFFRAGQFNQDIGDWNVSQVEDMESMFSGANSFNQDIGDWNVGNVREMRFMFGGTGFNQDIGRWDVSNVRRTQGMFDGNTDFDQDLGAWDISNLTTARNMFRNVTLSVANYDSLLQGWSTLDAGETQIPIVIEFHGGNSQFCEGGAARQELTTTFEWILTDGGESGDAPVAVCQNIEVALNASGEATITPQMVDGGSTDDCGIATISIDRTDFASADLGDNTVTLTVTDFGGQTANCEAIVTIVTGGAQQVSVPNVIDLDQATAENNITSVGLLVGNISTENSDTIAMGNVIAQSPIGNTNVDIGTEVDLVISLGPVQDVLTVTNFYLINADTDTRILELVEGTIIDVTGLSTTNLNIEAVTTDDVESVRLELTGAQTQGMTENFAPYALFGDISGDFNVNNFPLGDFIILATPFSEDNLEGEEGTPLAINFTFADQNPLCENFDAFIQIQGNPTTCGGMDGFIGPGVTGATDPTYELVGVTGPQVSNFFSGLSAGDYTIIVVDANGCNETLMVTLEDPPMPEVELEAFESILDTDVPFALGGGAPLGGVYSGEGVNNGIFDPSVTGTGIFEITYTFTDPDTNCSSSASQNITVLSGEVISITEFILVNADTNSPIMILTDGDEIAIDNLPTTNLSIEAVATAETGSVRLELSGALNHIQTENIVPYALFGDDPQGMFNGRDFIVGSYSINATPFSEFGLGGIQGEILELSFTLIEEAGPAFEVISYTLIDAETDEDIMEIEDGMSIDLSTLPTSFLSIRANTIGEVQSVRFQLRGAINRNQTESVVPYALFGDVAPDYFGRDFVVGEYNLNAVPFSETAGTGEAGGALTVHFTIVDNQSLQATSSQALRLYPNSAREMTHILTPDPTVRLLEIVIYDMQGRKVTRFDPSKVRVGTEYRLPIYQIQTGVYIVHTIDDKGKTDQMRLMVER